MENALNALDTVLPFVIFVGAISLSFALIVSSIFLILFYQKKIDLQKGNDIIEENRLVVEEATFLKYSSRYQEILEKMMTDIRELSAQKRKLEAQNEDIETESKRNNKRGSKKKETVTKDLKVKSDIITTTS